MVKKDFTSFFIVCRRQSSAPVYVPGGEHWSRVLIVSKLDENFMLRYAQKTKAINRPVSDGYLYFPD